MHVKKSAVDCNITIIYIQIACTINEERKKTIYDINNNIIPI